MLTFVVATIVIDVSILVDLLLGMFMLVDLCAHAWLEKPFVSIRGICHELPDRTLHLAFTMNRMTHSIDVIVRSQAQAWQTQRRQILPPSWQHGANRVECTRKMSCRIWQRSGRFAKHFCIRMLMHLLQGWVIVRC